MSFASTIRVAFEPLRSIAFGDIGASYMGVGSSFVHPVRMLIVENLTNALLSFSIDGINDHFVLPANGPLIMDLTTNKTQSTGFFLSEGDRIYVKEIGVPTSGSVYVSVIYGRM